MLSLEKNHGVELNLLPVISRSRNQTTNSRWVSSPRWVLPTAASPAYPGFPGSCRAALQGKQFPVPVCPGTPELPGPASGEAAGEFLPQRCQLHSSPGHVPCAVSSSRGGFLSGINCLNPSAVLKNTGGREEDLLERVISSAKHVILKLS